MSLTKLSSVAIRLADKNSLLQRLPIRPAKALFRCRSSRSDDDNDLDKPIKFSTSEAATWNAEYSRTGGPPDDSPWYQYYVVSSSVAIFLIYFGILREENDIDEKLSLDLLDHFQGEKRRNLEASMKLPQEIAARRSL